MSKLFKSLHCLILKVHFASPQKWGNGYLLYHRFAALSILFLNFFKSFFRLFSSLCLSRRQLVYYTTYFSACQHFLQNFFQKSFSFLFIYKTIFVYFDLNKFDFKKQHRYKQSTGLFFFTARAFSMFESFLNKKIQPTQTCQLYFWCECS